MNASRDDGVYWYKNAVVYQLHVRSFHDGNGDGTGDFAGLIEKLDYLAWLGVSAVWLLPFYPSPLRDDGYDVMDYRGINPSYGTMRDFRAFVKAAHARGIKVITELILNHTSDQHPWFQRARRARRGSAARNFYVWSDTDTKFADTRIIFTDTENSNWAWDPVAEQYYWHRFFSHQPDLNYDSPNVVREMMNIMRFWFQIGVDGLRLDAAPYLCVKEGTSNENIPETHAVMKRLRAFIDEEFPGRILLAEANQWPEDVQTYFGDGDECQMAYHFPLMPRLFLSLATQDRFPIYDIMQQTPEIPENSQWAIFLRNHDEMTLEMVTDRERAFMYQVYAPEQHARINVGIRRRLAPLLGNDRRKIELMMSLLLSMRGTPILYYGDEIGMGDNIFLKDRDGVRTPMQWSPDRNGGFSKADSQRLCLPVIQDTMYGYEVTNVEAQTRNTSSLLNWLRRLIGVRQSHHLFGDGRLTFLYPENRRIIAYFREKGDEAVLCVANLAENAQSVTLDLSRYLGRTPVEMIGWSIFPRIVDQRYIITLPGNAFFWFLLRDDQENADVTPTRIPETATIVLPRGWRSFGGAAATAQLENLVLPGYLQAQRWFGAGVESVGRIRVGDTIELRNDDEGPVYLCIQAEAEWPGRTLFLMLDRSFDLGAYPLLGGGEIAKGRTGPHEFVLYDAGADAEPWRRLARAILTGGAYESANGRLHGVPREGYGEGIAVRNEDPIRIVGSDFVQSGVFDGALAVKLYRQMEPGIHPEIEMAEALERAEFSQVPQLLGALWYEPREGPPMVAGVAYRFVGHRGTGQEIALGLLRQRLERGRLKPTPSATGHRDDDGFGGFLRYAILTGKRIADLHRALCTQGDNHDFRVEQFDDDGVQAEIDAAIALIPKSILRVRQLAIENRLRRYGRDLMRTARFRVHGNLTLHNILVATDDIFFSGLEGDPALRMAERRRKRSPLFDLATMTFSFDIVAENLATHLASDRTEASEHLRPLVSNLARRAREALLYGYETVMGASIPRAVIHFYRLCAVLKEYQKDQYKREVSFECVERLLQAIMSENVNGRSA